MVKLSPEDIAQQEVLLETHRRTLAHLMKQAAHFSAGHLPAHIASGIDEARAEIAQIKAVLRDAEVSVAEHPDDALSLVAPLSRLPEKERRNRQAMIEKVRLTWIDGVLKKSLFNEALIALRLAEREGTVQRPYEVVRRRPGQEDSPLPSGTRIIHIYDAQEGALLILGAPGSGKTTLLLELARDLLDRATNDNAHPIPVVFNLASWAEKRQPLEVWLVDELHRQYDVSPRIGQPWIDAEQVLPLLDGLDEVVEAQRQDCGQAINAFRQEHGFLPLVVCCREAEYAVLPELRLHGAVVAQPLSKAQVSGYLHDAGASLTGLRAALEDDSNLWELLDTPLMLSIMTLTYQGKSAEAISGIGTLDQRRSDVFAAYVDALFERPRAGADYTREQTLHWLGWLAAAMQRMSQSIFYLEWMQPSWLPAQGQQHTFRWFSGLIGGLIGGLVSGLVGVLAGGLIGGLIGRPVSGLVGGLIGGLVSGLSGGLFFGLIIGLGEEIRLAETLHWSWAKVRHNWRGNLSFGLIGGLVGLLAGGLVGWLVGGLAVGLAAGVAVGLAAGVAVGLAAALFDGLQAGVLSTRMTPNEGIRRSRRSALISALVGALVGALIGTLGGALSFWLIGVLDDVLDNALGDVLVGVLDDVVIGALVGALVGALGGALVGALKNGGITYIQHYILRHLLVRYGYAPWSYAAFLDECADRIFLRKVGGGYIFVHRLLLEYFVSLSEEDP